jgi:hypothetical protein
MRGAAMTLAKKVVVLTLLAALGLGTGYGIGYVADVVEVMSHSPVMLKSCAGSGFARVHGCMAQLQALDTFLVLNIKNPKKIENKDDLASLWAAWSEQQRIIDDLSQSSKAVGLNPQLEIARAINSERAAQLAELEGDQKRAEGFQAEVQSHLISAGWVDPTEKNLRKQLQPLDRY